MTRSSACSGDSTTSAVTSRFTTWAYKFALLEAAVKLRKRSWQGREVPLDPEAWSLFASAGLGSRREAGAE